MWKGMLVAPGGATGATRRKVLSLTTKAETGAPYHSARSSLSQPGPYSGVRTAASHRTRSPMMRLSPLDCHWVTQGTRASSQVPGLSLVSD